MRKALLAAAFAVWVPGAHAQTSVVDIPAISQLYEQYGQQIKDAAVQLQQLQKAAQQVEWAVQAYNSFVANPSFGAAMGLMQAAGISNPLPISPYTIQALISGQGGINGTLGALSTFATSAASTNHVYTPTDGTWASQQLIANANGTAGAQGIGEQMASQMALHFPIVQSLQSQLTTATTPAARESLMGQIQAQQAYYQGAQAQIQTASLLLVAQQQNRAQQADEQLAKSLDGQLDQARAAGVIQ